MTSTRKNYPAALKAKVALAALREDAPLSELAVKFGLHGSVISRWKREALQSLEEGFKGRTERVAKDHTAELKELHAKIGELIIEKDFLDCPDGVPLIVHDRILKILQEMCPDDFQVFEVIIKNLNPKDPPFENKEFHLININNKIEALDMEKSEFRTSPNGLLIPTKRVYKTEDCWNGHLLSKEKFKGHILFHPSLAKKFRRSKGVQFLTDKEAPC